MRVKLKAVRVYEKPILFYILISYLQRNNLQEVSLRRLLSKLSETVKIMITC